jgi:hypothetical protein
MRPANAPLGASQSTWRWAWVMPVAVEDVIRAAASPCSGTVVLHTLPKARALPPDKREMTCDEQGEDGS